MPHAKLGMILPHGRLLSGVSQRNVMPGDTYPKFTVAAVQAASVWLDRDATIEKVEALTSQAARNGAALVVFSESYIPAFPVWNLTHHPLDQPAFFRRLYDHALLIPGSQFRKLAAIAQSSGVYLSVGVTEKTETSMGTLWNSNLLFLAMICLL